MQSISGEIEIQRGLAKQGLLDAFVANAGGKMIDLRRLKSCEALVCTSEPVW